MCVASKFDEDGYISRNYCVGSSMKKFVFKEEMY